jgi:hypothetical protein
MSINALVALVLASTIMLATGFGSGNCVAPCVCCISFGHGTRDACDTSGRESVPCSSPSVCKQVANGPYCASEAVAGDKIKRPAANVSPKHVIFFMIDDYGFADASYKSKMLVPIDFVIICYLESAQNIISEPRKISC